VSETRIQLAELPPLSLYIHIPWCIRKCPYCDFNSHEAPAALPESAYVAALLRDLEQEMEGVQQRRLCSIFFGGGTPSLLSPEAIHTLLENSRRLIGWEEDIELTLEANPGAVDAQKFIGFRAAGINRLSIGVQSFDDRRLQALGRVHSAADAMRAFSRARAAGFENINLDLMYGLPRQDATQAMTDLQTAIGLEPEHVSWYELTLEPNTEFYKRPPKLPSEPVLESIESGGRARLQQAGYSRYEISAFARLGEKSQHNSNYWQFGDYIGIGAGAHSKVSTPDANRIRRSWKTRMPLDYMARNHCQVAGKRDLNAAQLPLEFMMNVLRLSAGVPSSFYRRRTGLNLATIEPALEQLRQRGLLRQESDQIGTTERGERFLDSILQTFMD
jgi:oxygen-independent coproporphyrinogen-3 oxidase